MPKTKSLASLPPEILTELQQRLVKSGFSQFDSHVEWLRGQGHTTSRSAVHRYAVANASAMLAQANLMPQEMVEVKLRCLEIAGSLGRSTTADELIDDAKAIMKWVYTA